MVAVQPVGNV
jgi:hypothetical protein